MGVHLLLEDMSYWIKCLTGSNVLLDQMSYCKTILSGGHLTGGLYS